MDKEDSPWNHIKSICFCLFVALLNFLFFLVLELSEGDMEQPVFNLKVIVLVYQSFVIFNNNVSRKQ